jgi:hypothetical protein
MSELLRWQICCFVRFNSSRAMDKTLLWRTSSPWENYNTVLILGHKYLNYIIYLFICVFSCGSLNDIRSGLKNITNKWMNEWMTGGYLSEKLVTKTSNVLAWSTASAHGWRVWGLQRRDRVTVSGIGAGFKLWTSQIEIRYNIYLRTLTWKTERQAGLCRRKSTGVRCLWEWVCTRGCLDISGR